MKPWLLYGANGYTGTLLAHHACARGLHPILAGRNAHAVQTLAESLKLPWRVFALDDPTALAQGLEGISLVLNAAGPFVRTAEPLVRTCLARRCHYLDVTGELAVFEALAQRDAEARAAGILLLPGVGMDVVPSDCLALHLKQRLPTATHLALGFQTSGRFSRGTATTVIENIARGGAIRRAGKLTPVPTAWKHRVIDFGLGQRAAVTIPWGDVSTAFHTTAIPNIEVYVPASWPMRVGMRASRYLGWLLGSRAVQTLLLRRVRSGPAGPSAAERSRGWVAFWGEATDPRGRKAVTRLLTPEGYTLTALTAIACVEAVLTGKGAPGFHTPARLLGADFILGIPGVGRVEEPLT